MLKIRTRLILVMLVVAAAVTAVLSAIPAAAEATIGESAKPYTFGTKATGTMKELYPHYPVGGDTYLSREIVYSFTLPVKTTVTIDAVAYPADDRQTYDLLLGNSNCRYDDYGDVYLNRNSDYTSYKREIVDGEQAMGHTAGRPVRNIANGKAAIRDVYTDLVAGTYYLLLGEVSAESNSPGIKYELTVTPEPFKAGSVAADVTAFFDTASNKIVVDWDEVRAARYAVYYTYFNNTTKAFGEWTIAEPPVKPTVYTATPAASPASASDSTAGAKSISYTIPTVVKNATYYITILPFSDIPSRQYGGFSPYAVVHT